MTGISTTGSEFLFDDRYTTVTSNFTTPSSVTDEEDIQISKALLFVCAPAMILISCLGIIGNILVVGAVIAKKQLQVILNVFIVNLAFADFLVCSILNPFAVVGVFDGVNFFRHFPVLCEILGTLTVVSFVNSLWSLSFVALNRYVYICHRYYYSKIFTRCSIPGMIAFIWIFALLLDLPNYLGWGDHIFDKRNFTCTYDYSANFGYTRGYLVVFGFVTPVSMLNLSYIGIYLFARKASRNLSQHSPSSSKIEAADKRLLQTIGIIWIVFMIMWLPYATTVIFDLGHITTLFMPASLLAFMNSSVNFLVYATNAQFKEGYALILRKVVCLKVDSSLSGSEMSEVSRSPRNGVHRQGVANNGFTNI